MWLPHSYIYCTGDVSCTAIMYSVVMIYILTGTNNLDSMNSDQTRVCKNCSSYDFKNVILQKYRLVNDRHFYIIV